MPFVLGTVYAQIIQDETTDKKGKSHREVTAFVKVTQSLSAHVERKQKLYQAQPILISRPEESHSITQGRRSVSAGGDLSFKSLTSGIKETVHFTHKSLYGNSSRFKKKSSKREMYKDPSLQKILPD